VLAVVDEPPPLNFLASFPDIGDLSSDPAVVGTNLSLALGSLLVLLAATTIFNATLKENAEWFHGAAGRLPKPGSGAFAVAGSLSVLMQRLPQLSLLYPLALIGLTALIYSALDPHFGFNDSSLVLVVALIIGLALTTFLYEGGQVLFSQRAFGVPAAIRAYPVAIVIAAASVGLSRIVDLNPGVIFGFVAAAALTSGNVGNRQQGMIVFVPMLVLLGISLIALALVAPLRSLAEGQSSAWATLPETIAVTVFVGGAQSVLLSMIPLTFNDGEKVWTWNRRAWLALALPSTFLFFHVIINREGEFSSLSNKPGAIGPLIAALVFLVIACAVWLFFQLKRRAALPD
jgi:hypothetical protein